MMRKFFFLLTIVGASAVRAVTLNWSATNTSSDVSSWIDSMTNVGVVYSATGADVTSVAQVAMGGTAEGYNAVSDGSFSIPSYTPPLSGTFDLSDTALETVMTDGTYFLVMFNPETKGYAIMAISAEEAQSYWYEPGPGGGGVGKTFEGEFVTGTLVPEPTVLALLALGVAGLALRRRTVA